MIPCPLLLNVYARMFVHKPRGVAASGAAGLCLFLCAPLRRAWRRTSGGVCKLAWRWTPIWLSNKRLMGREFYAEYIPQSNSTDTGVVMKRESGIATAQCCGGAYLDLLNQRFEDGGACVPPSGSPASDSSYRVQPAYGPFLRISVLGSSSASGEPLQANLRRAENQRMGWQD